MTVLAFIDQSIGWVAIVAAMWSVYWISFKG